MINFALKAGGARRKLPRRKIDRGVTGFREEEEEGKRRNEESCGLG